MASDKDRETEDLLQLIHRQQQILNNLGKRSEEDERLLADMHEEAERGDAWLTSAGKWDLWDADSKQFIVPEVGWPVGYVRKAKEAPKPDDQRADAATEETAPDTLMHRMLRKAKSGF